MGKLSERVPPAATVYVVRLRVLGRSTFCCTFEAYSTILSERGTAIHNIFGNLVTSLHPSVQFLRPPLFPLCARYSYSLILIPIIFSSIFGFPSIFFTLFLKTDVEFWELLHLILCNHKQPQYITTWFWLSFIWLFSFFDSNISSRSIFRWFLLNVQSAKLSRSFVDNLFVLIQSLNDHKLVVYSLENRLLYIFVRCFWSTSVYVFMRT